LNELEDGGQYPAVPAAELVADEGDVAGGRGRHWLGIHGEEERVRGRTAGAVGQAPFLVGSGSVEGVY
jgi:hypothetical protein